MYSMIERGWRSWIVGPEESSMVKQPYMRYRTDLGLPGVTFIF